MKIQYLAVIFVIIIIPISLVLSQYLQNQIDTITLQSLYTSNLNNATHDTLKAFQINSVNNKYSSLSTSKIRDIEASINTFYNSLGTSMDKYIPLREELSTFIPAIVFTLYDGYYIYSSYDNLYANYSEMDDDQITLSSGNYQDGLRPFVYYSCKYKHPRDRDKVITINYTLDNYITVYGDFGNGYETKSGYLILPEKIPESSINVRNKTLKYDDITIKPEQLQEYLITVDNSGNLDDGKLYDYIHYNNEKVYKDGNTNKYFWYKNYKKTYLQGNTLKEFEEYLDKNNVGFKDISAFEYYYNAYDFSRWIQDTQILDCITPENVIVPEDYDENTNGPYVPNNTENKYFLDTRLSGNNDPMLESSAFNQHRQAVIRRSIETNLTTAIANYNYMSSSNYEFVMPKIDETNWNKIVNNVSVISFMQGMPIGHKYFNNYSVITNTRNQEFVNKQSIYILAQDERNNYKYHQPGCKELIEDNGRRIEVKAGYSDISFLRQTAKASEFNLKYFYLHTFKMNTSGADPTRTTGCYNCIVNASPDYDVDDIIDGKISEASEIRTAYLKALAREKYVLYKSNNLGS